jgi:hypothetical protein
MNAKLRLAWLGSAALVLISPPLAFAAPGDPIPGVEVGLEGDPEGVLVATALTDANGKFEFKGLKAGKYRLVLPPPSTPATTKVGQGTLILPSDSPIAKGSNAAPATRSNARARPAL